MVLLICTIEQVYMFLAAYILCIIFYDALFMHTLINKDSDPRCFMESRKSNVTRI